MKKIIIMLAMVFSMSMTVCNAQDIIRNGNTFSSTSAPKAKTPETKTKFTWKDSKGVEYPIYVSKTGSCYIKKVSKKTGKEYKQYLKPEVSMQVCKELGIKYTPKNK